MYLHHFKGDIFPINNHIFLLKLGQYLNNLRQDFKLSKLIENFHHYSDFIDLLDGGGFVELDDDGREEVLV